MALGDLTERRIHQAINDLGRHLDRVAQQATVDMRSDAPWTDRTGDARESLEATVEREGNRFTLTLGYTHEPTVTYGVFLEKKQAGRFAIVDPQAERVRQPIRRAVAEAFR